MKNRKRPATDPKIKIPERETILALLEKQGKPMKPNQIARCLDVDGVAGRRILDRRLNAMTREGQLVKNRHGSLGLTSKMDLISGKVIAHPEAYGFLCPDKGGADVFLPAREMRGILHGDRAVVRVTKVERGGRRAGKLVEVIERANQTVVGRFHQEGKMGWIVPDNKRLHQDILIPAEARNRAESGQFVTVRLTRQPDRHMQPVGEIIEVIGDVMDAAMVTDIAIRAYQLPFIWPEELAGELAAWPADVEDLEASGRADLRELDFVTIDGEDAQDFDDAVYCERTGSGWRLYVAIADVSHYVAPGSAVDREAWQRGTSVYFPQRVLPMLPELLANDLCSLRPGRTRLSMVCVMDFDADGKRRSGRFCRAMIRSKARLTYTEVAAMVIDRAAEHRARHAGIVAALDRLHALFLALHRQRGEQGLIEFSSIETRIEFDEQGAVQALSPLLRNDAHRLIEECMLMANIAAGEYLQKEKLPALYRVHPVPAQERLQAVRDFLREFALELEGGEQPATADYARLLAVVRDREDAHMIETVLLRSMPLAVYRAENIGHFGLGFSVYAHFTSPIRRYPDLLVHRAIGHLLDGGRADDFAYAAEFMEEAGEHCSTLERRAEEATRDAEQRIKCIYLQRHVGEDFDGRVSSVTAFGLFVELDALFVEGLVHISTLPQDYYHFDPVAHRLVGERSRRTFRLGDPLRVKVVRVSIDDKKIDFELLLGHD